MNTNSKPLSLYDILVAEIESAAAVSLHDLVLDLGTKCPKARRYEELPALIMNASALLQDQLHNSYGAIDMDKPTVLKNWGLLERGLTRMCELLESQGVFDRQRLPTNAVLAVIAAAYANVPEDGDSCALGDKLLRCYLWSSFFTDRYENAAATRAFADFKALKALLLDHSALRSGDFRRVPVLNRAESPLADADALKSAGWPKAAGIEARAILAVALACGAKDFADNKNASFEIIQEREYHHIFPAALLKEVGIDEHSLSLNCALITWKTNRTIGRKDPLTYLEDRIDWSNEQQIEDRLSSHLIPFEPLKLAVYNNCNADELKTRVRLDYTNFLHQRALWVATAAQSLADSGEANWTKLESEFKGLTTADAG